MAGCKPDVIDRHRFIGKDAAQREIVEHRFEQWTSNDGTCIIQTDVYVYADGQEKHWIYDIEINGRIYVRRFDKPPLISS